MDSSDRRAQYASKHRQLRRLSIDGSPASHRTLQDFRGQRGVAEDTVLEGLEAALGRVQLAGRHHPVLLECPAHVRPSDPLCEVEGT